MSPTWTFIFYLLAAISFGLAAISVSIHPRIQLIALGLLFWLLPALWTAGKAM